VLSSNLHLGVQNHIFLTEIFYAFPSHSCMLHALPIAPTTIWSHTNNEASYYTVLSLRHHESDSDI